MNKIVSNFLVFLGLFLYSKIVFAQTNNPDIWDDVPIVQPFNEVQFTIGIWKRASLGSQDYSAFIKNKTGDKLNIKGSYIITLECGQEVSENFDLEIKPWASIGGKSGFMSDVGLGGSILLYQFKDCAVRQPDEKMDIIRSVRINGTTIVNLSQKERREEDERLTNERKRIDQEKAIQAQQDKIDQQKLAEKEESERQSRRKFDQDQTRIEAERQQKLIQEKQERRQADLAAIQNNAQATTKAAGDYAAALFTTDLPGTPSFLDGKGSSLDFIALIGGQTNPLVANYYTESGRLYSRVESAFALTLGIGLPFWIYRNNYFGVGAHPFGGVGFSNVGESVLLTKYGGEAKILAGLRRFKLAYEYHKQQNGVSYLYYEDHSTTSTSSTNYHTGKAELKYVMERHGLGFQIDFAENNSADDSGESTLTYLHFWDKPSWYSGGFARTSDRIQFKYLVDVIVDFGYNYYVSGEQLYEWYDKEKLNKFFINVMIGKTFNLTHNVKRKYKN